ncbi:MAG TPA: EAL domain-containing protein [Rhodocyclaceae bacterium]|nr:EAL domain-containing protein [Rhodocyclaceae bacterium]
MSFLWNKQLETGIEVVDLQHRGLIELINEAAPFLASPDAVDAERTERLLDRLFAYAATHFKDEAQMMQERGVDPRHVRLHEAEHAHFAEQLNVFRQQLASEPNPGYGPRFLAFLIHWLSAHLLDVDHQMALQCTSIEQGVPPELAYQQALAEPRQNASRSALVNALVELYAVLDEHRKAAEQADKLGSFDQMTGLSNRNHFLIALSRLTATAAADGQAVALLLLDVDDMAAINQSCGHDVADQLLKDLADRLRALSRRADMVARVGDDEFALALVGSADAGVLCEAAERLYRQVVLPLAQENAGIAIGLSGGLSVMPDDAGGAEQLFAAAGIALAVAKRDGGGQCVRFSPSLAKHEAPRAEAIRALRDAIEQNQLVLHYQPQLSLHSGEIVGLEALVRWQHPTRGMVPPGQFIPLAEEAGLIIPLGEWVIRTVLMQLLSWREAELPLVRVAVNISARHFLHPGLVEYLTKGLRKYEIDAHLLELELTESVMMVDPALAIRVSEQLKAMGLRLSLDDFGTGYSSLAYLSRFAIDVVKIDQSFVRDITTNPINASIAVATIAMAHKLGKTVIAEGVETEGQMTYLRRHDCDEMQGYFFSRPVPPDEIADLLKRGAALKFGGAGEEEQPCLLLVDDEANILNALKRLLRREGYRILTASSGAQGLELLAANPVQVILSDQRMPEMTGSEFLSRVKEMYPDTVRMVLSGYAELASVTDAVNRGSIYKYLSKPWDEEELKSELRQAFRHQRGAKS